jgi:hypothetical protein
MSAQKQSSVQRFVAGRWLARGFLCLALGLLVTAAVFLIDGHYLVAIRFGVASSAASTTSLCCSAVRQIGRVR